MQKKVDPNLDKGGGARKVDLNSILLIKKMAIRAITFSTYMTRSRLLFRDLKILDVYQLHRLSICSFMYMISLMRICHIRCHNIVH